MTNLRCSQNHMFKLLAELCVNTFSKPYTCVCVYIDTRVWLCQGVYAHVCVYAREFTCNERARVVCQHVLVYVLACRRK